MGEEKKQRGTIGVWFRDETFHEWPEDAPASHVQPKVAPGNHVGQLVAVRMYRPNAATVWLWRDGRWVEAMYETYQQQIDRLTLERDAARAATNTPGR